jgi:hypothetical protein
VFLGKVDEMLRKAMAYQLPLLQQHCTVLAASTAPVVPGVFALSQALLVRLRPHLAACCCAHVCVFARSRCRMSGCWLASLHGWLTWRTRNSTLRSIPIGVLSGF